MPSIGSTAMSVSIGVPSPIVLAVEQHRRLVLLALADDDDAVHRHGVEHDPHGVDRGAVGTVLVAPAHPPAGGQGGGLRGAHQLQREVPVGALLLGHGGERTGRRSQRLAGPPSVRGCGHGCVDAEGEEDDEQGDAHLAGLDDLDGPDDGRRDHLRARRVERRRPPVLAERLGPSACPTVGGHHPRGRGRRRGLGGADHGPGRRGPVHRGRRGGRRRKQVAYDLTDWDDDSCMQLLDALERRHHPLRPRRRRAVRRRGRRGARGRDRRRPHHAGSHPHRRRTGQLRGHERAVRRRRPAGRRPRRQGRHARAGRRRPGGGRRQRPLRHGARLVGRRRGPRRRAGRPPGDAERRRRAHRGARRGLRAELRPYI